LLDLLFNKNPAEQAAKAPNAPEVATNNMKVLNLWVRDLAKEMKHESVLNQGVGNLTEEIKHESK
jgi:hypothetical protein